MISWIASVTICLVSLLTLKIFSLAYSVTLVGHFLPLLYLYNGDSNIAWTRRGAIMLRPFVRKLL